MSSTTTQPTRPRARDERAEMVRVLRTQVRSGRYQADAEQVAEQLLAWFSEV